MDLNSLITHIGLKLKSWRWHQRPTLSDSRRTRRKRSHGAEPCYETLEPRSMLSAYFPAYINGQFTLGDRSQAAPYGLENTFLLESLPAADKTIYLDFDGYHSVGNSWGHNIQFPKYDRDGHPGSFSDAERIEIQKIFQNVAEDFLPFQVNVTTRFPGEHRLKRTGANDPEFGARVVMTQITDGFGAGTGGRSKYNIFGDSRDIPVFVFNKGAKYAADTVSHEVGHTFGLHHNGTANLEYYPGHGSGDTRWGPLMGAPYSAKLSQWSRGDYPNSNNQEDDLAILTGSARGLDYRFDDIGDAFASARTVNRTGNRWFASGIISTRSDVDMFRFTVDTGQFDLQIKPFQGSPNLDVLARLYDSSGHLIASRNPIDRLNATFQLELDSGTYYLAVDGVGRPGQYTDYGSLGFYTVEATLQPQVNVTSVGETGTIDRVDHNWKTIQLRKTYRDPVIIIGPPTQNGPRPTTVRVRNVTSTRFEIQMDEWDYQDGLHEPESVSYLVVEAGTHRLSDGTILRAQNSFINHLSRRTGFGFHFASTPVVLAQTISTFDPSAVTPRVHGVDTGGFSIRLQEQERSDRVHAYERVSWIAIEPGLTFNDGMRIEATLTRSTRPQLLYRLEFEQAYQETPLLFANLQSFRGTDPATLRMRRLTSDQAVVRVEEEQSLDSETDHRGETIGWLAIKPGYLFARTDAPSQRLLPAIDEAFTQLDSTVLGNDGLTRLSRPTDAGDSDTPFGKIKTETGTETETA